MAGYPSVKLNVIVKVVPSPERPVVLTMAEEGDAMQEVALKWEEPKVQEPP